MANFDAEYWRERAKATFLEANRARWDKNAKARLLRVAREYAKLAEVAEKDRSENIIRIWRRTDK